MAWETVDPIDWSHPPPYTGQYPLSSMCCTLQFGLGCKSQDLLHWESLDRATFGMPDQRTACAATQGLYVCLIQRCVPHIVCLSICASYSAVYLIQTLCLKTRVTHTGTVCLIHALCALYRHCGPHTALCASYRRCTMHTVPVWGTQGCMRHTASVCLIQAMCASYRPVCLIQDQCAPYSAVCLIQLCVPHPDACASYRRVCLIPALCASYMHCGPQCDAQFVLLLTEGSSTVLQRRLFKWKWDEKGISHRDPAE